MLRVGWRKGVAGNVKGECERVYWAMLRVSVRGCSRQC